ncbi:Hypothetical predicted protein [Mytilus galloprovincialis]|uniref:Ankyrin repeat protein n=1 Tax=Mytilus galloprovincialis TaxID=29158 RepID=A0A8B6HEH6_MYTGA|nr:Hypothetical predicted protein [Mytilus galloprovincialis]
MCRKGHSGIVNQLLRIIRPFTSPEVIDCARKACEQDKLEIVQWLIKALNSNNYLKSNSLFNMKMALNIACQGEDEIHILDFLLQNVVHKQFDMKAGIETAIRVNNIKIVQMLLKSDAHQLIYTNIALNYACRFNRIDIIKALLQSISSTAIDIPTMKSVLNKGIEFNRSDIAKCVLDKCDHSLLDLKRIFIDACYNDKFEILGFLILFVHHKLLDMNKAIYVALDEFPKISLRVIELLLTHSDRSLFDMAYIREILHRACRNNEIHKIKILVEHFDNLTLDLKTAMKNAYRYFCFQNSLLSYKNKDLRIMEFLAGTVDNTLLGFDSVMNDACKDENLLVVQWLVENVDNTLFDDKTALDYAIGEDKEDDDDSEFFNFDIIDFLLKRLVTEDVLPYITEMHRLIRVACFHFNKNIVQLLIDKVDNSLLGIDTVMDRACSIGRLDVVEWLVENIDNTLFDVKTALDCAIGEDEENDDDSEFFNFDIIDFLLKRLVTEDVLPYITECID